jgi:hypothetical protein
VKVLIPRDGKNIACVDFDKILFTEERTKGICFFLKDNTCVAYENLKEQDIKSIFSQIKKFNEKVSTIL